MTNPLTANRAIKPTQRLPEWVRRSVLNTQESRALGFNYSVLSGI